MNKSSILLIDDDRFVREGLGQELEKKGYKVTKAESGEKASVLLDKKAFDLVIVDIVMEKIDGFEIVEKVKELYPETMTLVLTGYKETQFAIDALRIGVDDYLLKPCETEDLLFSIQRCLEKKKLIQEKTRAEESLKRSEEKYRSLFSTIPDAIVIFDAETRRLMDVNDSASRLYGYTRDEFLELKQSDISAEPEDSERSIKETLAGKLSWIPLRYHKKKDGTTMPVEISTTKFQIGDHEVLCGVIRDITERRQAEEMQRESEQRFRTVADFTNDSEYWIGPANNLIYQSPSIEHITGYPAEEFIENHPGFFSSLVHPEDKEQFSKHFESDLNSSEVTTFAFRVISRSGEVRWLENITRPVYDSEGIFLGRRGSSRDITERKNAEMIIEEERFKFKEYFENLPLLAYTIGLEGNIINCNQMVLQTLGYDSKDELIGKSLLTSVYAPSSRAKVKRLLGKWKKDKKPRNEELQIITKEGNIIDVLLNVDTIFDHNGMPLHSLSTQLDITERRQAEERLRQNEAELAAIYDNVPLVIILVDGQRRVRKVNAVAAKFAGRTSKGMIGLRGGEALRCVHHLDDPKGCGFGPYCASCTVRQSVLDTYATGNSHYQREATLPFSTRSEAVTFLVSAVPLELKEERMVCVIIEDITEHKTMQRTLEISHSFLEIASRASDMATMLNSFVAQIKKLTDCSAVGIRILDSNGNIPYAAYDGFSRGFYESESPLSIKTDRCMCINVVKGDTDPSLSFYTEHGSFYMNGTTGFLATVSEEEKGWTRNACNEQGYESVALIPVRTGNGILGLVHIADPRENMVPLQMVKTLEEASSHLGGAIRRVWAEEALQEEKKRLEVTLDGTSDGIITTDLGGTVILFNRAAANLTGCLQEEAIGRPIEDLFVVVDERDRKPVTNSVETVLKTRQAVELAGPVLLISRDGRERVITDSGVPIYDEQGRLFGVVSVFHDITESRKLQEEQSKVSKLESIGMLAGGIAHDFNNLLTGIMGNIGLAKRYIGPGGEAIERLDEAEKASVRARDLTHQLLVFAKGGMPVKKLVSIPELIRESVTFTLRGSNVKPEFTFSEGLWTLEIDVGQISQVINNTVINADEAMPNGGVLNIAARNMVIKRKGALPLRRGKYVEITIEDHGVGISQEHLPKIFEPYFTTKQKGSGLGLATTYSILKNHDGYITADSVQNTGTTFHIYLPASSKPATAKSEAIVELFTRQKGKILVMDDEEMIREMLSHVLRFDGYKVESVKDGSEVIERFAKAKKSRSPFDAVIMDLTVPGGMGGKEVISNLLEIDPGAKVIVSSGYATDPIMADYRKYGFTAVVTKPYSIRELEEILHAVLTETK